MQINELLSNESMNKPIANIGVNQTKIRIIPK